MKWEVIDGLRHCKSGRWQGWGGDDCPGFPVGKMRCQSCQEERDACDSIYDRESANRYRMEDAQEWLWDYWLGRDYYKAVHKPLGQSWNTYYRQQRCANCRTELYKQTISEMGPYTLCEPCHTSWVNARRRWKQRETIRISWQYEQIRKDKKQWRIAKRTMKELTKLVKNPEALQLLREEYTQAQNSLT